MSLILQEFTGAPAETESSLEKKQSVCLKFHKTIAGLFRVGNVSCYSMQQLLNKAAEDNEGL